jgi:Family of unknown function (DUF6090)
MILRRVIQHVKKQEWTAIWIDLVIVVVGVFIGIQVANWNEDRRDREREQAYLKDIAAELDESILSIEHAIELEQQRFALNELLVRAAADPEIARAEPGRFVFAITRGGWTFEPIVSDNTFETIKASGDLGIFRDRRLIRELMALYTSLQGSAQWSQLKALNQSEYNRRAAGILTAQEMMLAPPDSNIVPSVDVDTALAVRKRILESPAFIEWLPTIMFNRADNLDGNRQLLERVKALRARVIDQTGGRQAP